MKHVGQRSICLFQKQSVCERHVISIIGITDIPIHSTALAANVALVMLTLSPGVCLLEITLSVFKLLQIEILGGILCLDYIFVSAGSLSAAHPAELKCFTSL